MTIGATDSEWDRFGAYLPDLLPVVSDLTVPISPDSAMKELGKTPSRINHRGQAAGIAKWTQQVTTAADVALWRREPRYGICVQTRRLRAIDIDVPDAGLADEIQSLIELVVGPLPCRSRSNSGKRLLVVVVDEGDFPKRVIRLGDAGIIELLANGQQFIAAGTHPSGARYEWSGPGEVVLTMAQLDAVWEALAAEYGQSVELRVGERPTVERRAEDIDDEVVRFLERTGGWITGRAPDGRVDVRCPWAHEHSMDSGPTATSWFPAGVGGFERGHFRCLHASHVGKTDGDFIEAIGMVADEFAVVPEPVEVAVGRRDGVLGYWKDRIAQCSVPGVLRDSLCESIAADGRVDGVVRELLATAVKARMKVLGEDLSIAAVRGLLSRRRESAVDVALPDWCADWVFRADKDKYYHTVTAEELTITGFNQRFDRELPEAPPGESVSAHQYVIRCMPSVAGARYIPYLGAQFTMDGRVFVNSYRESTVPPAAASGEEDWDAIGVVEAHLRMIAGDEGADVLRSWMAWNVQNPGRKVRWVPLIKGIPGDGKSVLATLMVGVMGGSNVTVISPQVLATPFNGWAEGHCVGVLEEIRMVGHNRHDTQNALKAALTNDRIPIHRKGQDEYQTLNTQNYLAFTNFEDAVPLDDGDRRWCVIFTPFGSAEELPDGAYFDRLHDVIYGSAPSLRRWLLDVDLTGFKPDGRAPEVRTVQRGVLVSGKQRMAAMSRNPAIDLVEEVVEQGGLGIGEDVISGWHFTQAYKNAGGTDGNNVGRHLRALGWEQIAGGAKIRWQGRIVRVWSRTCNNMQDARILLDKTVGEEFSDND